MTVAAMDLQQLPHDVLRDILSRLSLKQATRMGMLSREWRRLGIYHPNMVFTTDTFFDPDNAANKASTAAEDVFVRRRMTPEFIANVGNVLRPLWSTPTTATTTTLDWFVVKFGLCRCHAHHVDGWIHIVTMSRAKHIALHFTVGGDITVKDNKYIFPLCELGGPNGSSVESLDLANDCLEVPAPGFLGISNLKELKLRAVSINGEVLLILLRSSAHLECLTIKNCLLSSPYTLCNAIKNLKELSLSSMYSINGEGLRCLLLGCALLESLSIETIHCLKGLSIRQELHQLKYLKVCMCKLKSIELHALNLTTFVFDDPLPQIVFTGSPKLLEATIVLRRKLTGLDEYIDDPFDYTLAEFQLLFLMCTNYFYI